MINYINKNRQIIQNKKSKSSVLKNNKKVDKILNELIEKELPKKQL